MLVASELATLGSVIANAERMVPSSSGFRYFSLCSAVPKSANTSMLPVSGALQLHASDASLAAAHDLGQRRVLEIGQPGPHSGCGMEEIPQATPARLGLEFLDDRRVEVRVAGVAHLLVVHGLRRAEHVCLTRLDMFRPTTTSQEPFWIYHP